MTIGELADWRQSKRATMSVDYQGKLVQVVFTSWRPCKDTDGALVRLQGDGTHFELEQAVLVAKELFEMVEREYDAKAL